MAPADRPRPGAASIGTPAGEWHLGWDPTQATFCAQHWRRTGPDGRGPARADHELGVTLGAYPSVGALEEALGFAVPGAVRASLTARRDRNPALASPRGASVPESERPRGVDTYPAWESEMVAGTEAAPAVYGLCVEQERPVSGVDLGGGTRLDVLSGTAEPATGAQRVEYRLSHDGRVVFAGEDVDAPQGADLADDDALRALLGVLLDPDATHRARPLTPSQDAFVATHAPRLLAAVDPPAHPFLTGTRVAVAGDGPRHTGTVAHAIADRDGKVLAYAWRPDTAALVGHPWRYQPDHTLISAPDRLTPTLAPPQAGIPEQGAPLVFGAVVTCADPTSGARVEATVVRAFATGDGFDYQVQPNTAELASAFTVSAGRCAIVAGTWWPTARDIISARKQAGIDIVAGEVFAAQASATVAVVGDGRYGVAPLTPAARAAALTVDVDEPAPSLVRVSTHGQLTRVGDPGHGWIVVATDRWLAAMCRPTDELRATITGHAPAGTLGGDEPRPTLAALAARHAPDTLGPTPASLAKRFAAPVELTQTGAGL